MEQCHALFAGTAETSAMKDRQIFVTSIYTSIVPSKLEELKIMDVIKGKAGVAGRGKKDMGGHKVCHPCIL